MILVLKSLAATMKQTSDPTLVNCQANGAL